MALELRGIDQRVAFGSERQLINASGGGRLPNPLRPGENVGAVRFTKRGTNDYVELPQQYHHIDDRLLQLSKGKLMVADHRPGSPFVLEFALPYMNPSSGVVEMQPEDVERTLFYLNGGSMSYSGNRTQDMNDAMHIMNELHSRALGKHQVTPADIRQDARVLLVGIGRSPRPENARRSLGDILGIGKREKPQAKAPPQRKEKAVRNEVRPDFSAVTDATHIGKRDNNEDFILRVEKFRERYPHITEESLRKGGYMFVVADGVGGGQDGEKASKLASNVVMSEYYKQINALSGKIDMKARQRCFQIAVASAHRSVRGLPREGKKTEIGTTMTAAVLLPPDKSGKVEGFVGHVGDSRAYLNTQQLTKDHTLAQQLLDNHALTPEEAKVYPHNVVARSIGHKDGHYQPEFYELKLKLPRDANNLITLCTDGVSNEFTDDPNVLAAYARNGAQQLVWTALARGKSGDNKSAIVIDVGKLFRSR